MIDLQAKLLRGVHNRLEEDERNTQSLCWKMAAVIWANRSLDWIAIGSAIYCTVFFPSVGQNKRGRLVTYLYRWQYMVKILIWVIYSKNRICDSEVQWISSPVRWLTVTHWPQNIKLIRAGAVPEDIPNKQDNSASNCNSMFSNRGGDKETKLMGCSFK